MKGYILNFKSCGTNGGFIYCIAESDVEAKEYIANSIDEGKVVSI